MGANKKDLLFLTREERILELFNEIGKTLPADEVLEFAKIKGIKSLSALLSNMKKSHGNQFEVKIRNDGKQYYCKRTK